MDKTQVTGLILAGGRASRMGGVNKGLQAYQKQTLIENAIHRLAPQVKRLFISANDDIARYASFGHPVLTDADERRLGPLAGMLAALQQCQTAYLLCVPVDTPRFPLNLLQILSPQPALRSESAATVTATGASSQAFAAEASGVAEVRAICNHPVFCLLPTSVTPALVEFLQSDAKKRVRDFLDAVHCEWLTAPDETAFANANTLAELQALQVSI